MAPRRLGRGGVGGRRRRIGDGPVPASARQAGRPSRPHAGRSAASAHGSRRPTLVVGRAEVQVHLEAVGGQGGGDGVAPLDDDQASSVEEVVEAEVGQLGGVLEPVHVDVVRATGGPS